LPDVFARPQFVEPSKDPVDSPVAGFSICERSAAELLSTKLKKDSVDEVCGPHMFPMQLEDNCGKLTASQSPLPRFSQRSDTSLSIAYTISEEPLDDAINYAGQTWGQRNDVIVTINGDSEMPDQWGVSASGLVHSGWYAKRFTNMTGGSGFAWMRLCIPLGHCGLSSLYTTHARTSRTNVRYTP
jgi:hypothetical protein